MDYCACGTAAEARCTVCGGHLCGLHVRGRLLHDAAFRQERFAWPDDARRAFDTAWGDYDTVCCEPCRETRARSALAIAQSMPKPALPGHYLDRAVALVTDGTRTFQERAMLGRPPETLTVDDLVSDFITRATSLIPLTTTTLYRGGLRGDKDMRVWEFRNARRTRQDYTWDPPVSDVPGGSGTLVLGLYLTPAGERYGPEGFKEHGRARVRKVPDEDVSLPGFCAEMAVKLARASLF